MKVKITSSSWTAGNRRFLNGVVIEDSVLAKKALEAGAGILIEGEKKQSPKKSEDKPKPKKKPFIKKGKKVK